jgi:hypothetical protein
MVSACPGIPTDGIDLYLGGAGASALKPEPRKKYAAPLSKTTTMAMMIFLGIRSPSYHKILEYEGNRAPIIGSISSEEFALPYS